MTEKKVTSKKKNNYLKLFSSMNERVIDAVDKEITKRFKSVIDTIEEDITKVTLNAIMKQPDSIDLSAFSDGVQPYIRHYIFMMKRGESAGKNKEK